MSKRLSSIELCRIVAILCVMLIHSTFASLGNDVSWGVLLLAGFSIVGVNVFVMLTGYFSASPKVSSLLNLFFVCLFWVVVRVVVQYLLGQSISYKDFFFITTSNWFIPSYIGLLFFSPVLNSFCNSVDKNTLWRITFILLFIEVWFDWIPPSPAISLGTNGGHSVLSFLILYLLARAIRMHGVPEWFKKASPLIYLGCSFLLAVMASVLARNGYAHRVRWVFVDNNPIVILSAVAFMLSFERMKIDSEFINHIAKSTLAVLLGHSAIFMVYTEQFKYLYDHYDGLLIAVYWALAIIIVFVASILLDQLRQLLWRPIGLYLESTIRRDRLFP